MAINLIKDLGSLICENGACKGFSYFVNHDAKCGEDPLQAQNMGRFSEGGPQFRPQSTMIPFYGDPKTARLILGSPRHGGVLTELRSFTN